MSREMQCRVYEAHGGWMVEVNGKRTLGPFYSQDFAIKIADVEAFLLRRSSGRESPQARDSAD